MMTQCLLKYQHHPGSGDVKLLGTSFIAIKIYNKDINVITDEEFYTYILNIPVIPTNNTENVFNKINYLFLSQITWLPFELETQVF